jgi:hypothetical protein
MKKTAVKFTSILLYYFYLSVLYQKESQPIQLIIQTHINGQVLELMESLIIIFQL